MGIPGNDGKPQMITESKVTKPIGIGIVGIGFMGMNRAGFKFLSEPSTQV